MKVTTMGDVGEPVRRREHEPLPRPETAPVTEPAAPSPAPARPEPVPA